MRVLLLTTGVLQGVAVYVAGPDALKEDRPAARVRTAVKDGLAMQVRPAVVRAPSKHAGATKATRPSGDDALALARVYRAKGYKVSDKLAREIYRAAVENEIPPKVAFGLVKTESEFKDRATSRVGAIGLTQLMLPTARWFKKGVTVADLRDSRTNLRIGFRYLSELVDRYDGDWELALLAYNRGSGTVDRVLQRGGDPNNGYVEKVMGLN